jgi:hypothetical protein
VTSAVVAETSDELLGELAHELSLLVRSDLELAVARRGPEIRRLAEEVGATVAAGTAILLALAALSWAAVLILALLVPSWFAPLVVAAAWLAVAGLLLRTERPRRLARRLYGQGRLDATASALADRREAEAQLRTTARLLMRARARAAVGREVDSAEHEGELLLREVLTALAAPGRVGIDLLGRIAGHA